MEGLTGISDLISHPAGLLILLGGLLVAVYFMRGRVDELRGALRDHNEENKSDFASLRAEMKAEHDKLHQRIGDVKDELGEVHRVVARLDARNKQD